MNNNNNNNNNIITLIIIIIQLIIIIIIDLIINTSFNRQVLSPYICIPRLKMTLSPGH